MHQKQQCMDKPWIRQQQSKNVTIIEEDINQLSQIDSQTDYSPAMDESTLSMNFNHNIEILVHQDKTQQFIKQIDDLSPMRRRVTRAERNIEYLT